LKQPGQYTHEEIYSQPESWSHAEEVLQNNTKSIQGILPLDGYQQVIFTGCGSTYYLACSAASIFQDMTGFPAHGMPASELWLLAKSSYISKGRILLIAFSRSGETTETIRACQEFRDNKRGVLITLVCYANSSLDRIGDINIVFSSGMENSIAQTRAFSTLFLGAIGLCAIWSNQIDILDLVPDISFKGRTILGKYRYIAEHYGRNLGIDRIYFLGSGVRYGIACELSLKMKEMSLTHSEAFHFLEFRHGPKAMVNRNTLVVGLVGDSENNYEKSVLQESKQLGAEIISMGETGSDISFSSGVEEVIRNILYLPVGQLLAFERSIAKGLDPDHPNNLDSVVKLTN
jgi:glucosamine--fructose-6-phosphate aminotransferase (isomerizing)